MVRSVVLAPLLVAGVVSFVFVRDYDHDGSTFLVRQQQARPLNSATVETAVKAAPDPVAEPVRARGTASFCTSLGTGGLLNPWRCSILYPSGRRVRYLVTIRIDGSFTGDHEIVRFRGRSYSDTGMITGCCVDIP
jgi:hypothetical protein